MASTYSVVGSATTIRVLSQTSAIDVEAIQIVTKPSGVRLTVQVPLVDYRAGNADGYLSLTSTLIEGILAAQPAPGQNLATAAVYSQDTDPSDLLAAYISFLVTFNPGGPTSAPLTEWVTFPMTKFEDQAAYAADPNPITELDAAYARLQALAAS